MLNLLHAADFHLDSPFSGLSAEQSALRRAELRQLPSRLTALAKARQAHLALLPGDLFDGSRVYPETVEALKNALEEMAIPVFIAPGNHDHFHPRSPYAGEDWPENVHIFTESRMTSVELPEINCVVHGCAFTSPHREDDPLAGFAAPKDGRIHLLCVHGEVAQAGTYAPIAPRSLAESGVCYAALGHIHAASGLQWAGDTAWAYPGCPEGRGFDECGEKGASLVTIDGGRVCAEALPICRRQYRIETVTLTDDLTFSPTDDLVRLILRGEQSRPVSLAALEAKWSPLFFHLELRDETTLPQDLWTRAEEDSLTGLFLRGMKQRLDAAGEADRAQLLLATRFGLAALEGGEDIRP